MTDRHLYDPGAPAPELSRLVPPPTAKRRGRSSGATRLLDRTVGVIVLQALARKRGSQSLPEGPRRIGVIIPTAIGDTILCSGVLSAISDRYPDATLFVFHGASNRAAVDLIPVWITPVECPFANPLKTIRLMRGVRPDLTVDLTPWPRLTAIYARIAAPFSIGFDSPGQHRSAAFDIVIPHHPDSHEKDNHAAAAALFSSRPYRSNVITEPFEPLPGVEAERLILCHTSAGGSRASDKAWPAGNWAELAQRLAARGWQIGFTGSQPDGDMVGWILRMAGLPSARAFSLCGKMSLAKLGGLLSNAKLLITIDTGILHLADSVGANILALHGPTHSNRWGARNVNATSLNSGHRAAGYIHYGYEKNPHGRATIMTHTVDEVFRAAIVKLAQTEL